MQGVFSIVYQNNKKKEEKRKKLIISASFIIIIILSFSPFSSTFFPFPFPFTFAKMGDDIIIDAPSLYMMYRELSDETLIKIFDTTPDFDINMKLNTAGYTFFLLACREKRVELLKHLLTRPGVDVNKTACFGHTAFRRACRFYYVEIIRLLLTDPRISINEKCDQGLTTLIYAVREMINYEAYNVIRMILDSGKEVDDNDVDEVIEFMFSQGGNFFKDIVCNKEAFINDLDATFFHAKLVIKHKPVYPSALFALIIFNCEGFIEPPVENHEETSRFFRIAARLPMEIQMMLCYRAFSLIDKDYITGKERDVALRELHCVLVPETKEKKEE
jgi:hypothetical protein